MSKRNVQGLVEKSIKTFFERRKKVLNKWKGILGRETQHHKDVNLP